jgi:hypothetical protein
MTSTRHRWAQRQQISPHKSERQCMRCETVMVSRHESEAGRSVHWKEFWRDQIRIRCEATPACDARLEVAQ